MYSQSPGYCLLLASSPSLFVGRHGNSCRTFELQPSQPTKLWGKPRCLNPHLTGFMPPPGEGQPRKAVAKPGLCFAVSTQAAGKAGALLSPVFS